jgi:predicted TIM-barrel fold metal-dependent hydrolase
MMDAYTHLDLSCADPIADMRARMAQAGIARALAVETWKGDNLPWLQKLIAEPAPQFRVALCFRPEQGQPLPRVLEQPAVVGVRVKTDDFSQLAPLTAKLEASGKWLVAHAATGIGPLTQELLALRRRAPGVPIYLPHLGWPRRDGADDPDWEAAVTDLAAAGNVVAGVSAIAYFSREPFPHSDVERFAARLMEKFGPAQMVAASDYPLMEKARYAEYIHLAHHWIGGADSGGRLWE